MVKTETAWRRFGLAMALAAAPGAAIAAQPIDGRWITQDRDAIVEIAPCAKTAAKTAAAQPLCGRILRFLTPPPGGDGQRDVNNPDAGLRGRTLLGLAVLTGFVADGDQWRGRIYDPKTGRSYRSILMRAGPKTLTVKGCIGPFCQAQSWSR